MPTCESCRVYQICKHGDDRTALNKSLAALRKTIEAKNQPFTIPEVRCEFYQRDPDYKPTPAHITIEEKREEPPVLKPREPHPDGREEQVALGSKHNPYLYRGLEFAHLDDLCDYICVEHKCGDCPISKICWKMGHIDDRRDLRSVQQCLGMGLIVKIKKVEP